MEELIRKQDALDVISHELRCGATVDASGLEVACDLINEMTAPESYGHAVERFEDLCEYFGYKQDAIDGILCNRDEFKKWLERMHWHVKECDRLSRALEERPERPRGKWIIKQDWYGYYGECSYCHKTQHGGKTDFCPNCGADMREEERT